MFAYLRSLDLRDFVVSAFPTSELREIMLDAERPAEEMFLKEIAGELVGDEWRGTNQEFYQLYADWCKKYEMRPRTAVGFGREMTPYMLRGWIGKWGTNGSYGKFIDLKMIRQ